MYFPYLRGRQFELIALREYAEQRGDNNNAIPIIEPVKNTFNSIKLALPRLMNGNVRFALVLNPQVGEKPTEDMIMESLNVELTNTSLWIPAYIVTNNYQEISRRIQNKGDSNVMLICSDMTDTSCSDFISLISSPKIGYVVSKENKTLKRALKGTGKKIIRLDDNFKAQKRNSDYLPMPAEKFSEEHIFYTDDNYDGFSDYTVIESEFKEGGGAPYAVAIHITFMNDNGEIWISHFASETNDDRANIQGKFAEAAKKAISFLDAKKLHNEALDELRNYYHNQTYPGLGMVKKIAIKNHLELVNSILSEAK